MYISTTTFISAYDIYCVLTLQLQNRTRHSVEGISAQISQQNICKFHQSLDSINL